MESTVKAHLSGQVDACVFDAYGTVFDVGGAIGRLSGLLGNKVAPLIALWRSKQTAYAWLRSLMGEYTDFWHVTGTSLDSAMSALGIQGETLRSKLMDSWLSLEAFPDVRTVLSGLREAGLKTAILSNGSPTMLIASVKSAGIMDLLSHVVSVDAVRNFKPHPDTYKLGAEKLALPPERICFASTDAWDVAAAGAQGFRTVWINRDGAPAERLPRRPEFVISGLSELPKLLGVGV